MLLILKNSFFKPTQTYARWLKNLSSSNISIINWNLKIYEREMNIWNKRENMENISCLPTQYEIVIFGATFGLIENGGMEWNWVIKKNDEMEWNIMEEY